jgi:hypothetical protein
VTIPNNTPPIFPQKILTHHFLGILPAYFLTTYFSTIYNGFVSFLLIGLLFQILCGILIRVFLSENPPKTDWRDHRASILTLITTAALPLSAAVISWQFPSLFDQRLLIMDASRLPVFLGLLVISTPLSLWGNYILGRSGFFHTIETAGPIRFLQKNRAGIVAALLFFLTYFILRKRLIFPVTIPATSISRRTSQTGSRGLQPIQPMNNCRSAPFTRRCCCSCARWSGCCPFH